MKKHVAYRIYCEITEKTYIGITSCGVKERMQCHIHRSKAVQHPLYEDVRLYGWESFTVTELASCRDYESAQELERLLILAHNSLFPNGYNLETGGNKGKCASDYAKKALSEAHKGIKHSADHAIKQAASMKAAYDRDGGKLRKLRSGQFKGKVMSEEQKAKIGAANKGKIRSPELRAHLSMKTKEYAARKKLEMENT